MSGDEKEDIGFSVTIAASACVNLQDHRTGETAAHIIHAVSVSQPVQSWTVLRDHVDFLAMDAALSGLAANLPSCESCRSASITSSSNGSTNSGGGAGGAQQRQDVDSIVSARNSAQAWLGEILRVPAVRESPVMRQFLCYGANVVPPQFEGLVWVNFTSGGEVRASHDITHHHQYGSGGTDGQCGHQQQEHQEHQGGMEMDDEIFALDDDPNAPDADDDDDGSVDSDDDPEYLQGRYEPNEEPLDRSEVMEIQQDQVEMVEDVGSLAQSMGASHLGRSLQLQREMMGFRQSQQAAAPPQAAPQIAINMTSVDNSGSKPQAGGIGGAVGGIGGAMAKAESQGVIDTQAHVAGIGDSFHRTAPVSAPRLDSFRMIKVVGKGSFGKVFLVREKQTSEMFALKVLKKDNIIKRNQVEHTRTERSVLGYVKHPFIVGLNMAFQSKDKLYFVLDYCAGGELFFHLGKVGKFAEQRACFYAAEITLAIEYVHNLDIVYRDLKPENVLLDSRGHVRLTDFGLSKEGISNSSSGANSFCGTPEYLAPEILNRQGHGRAVDWWSLGALLFEMLTGLPPFYCRDREKLFEKIRRGTLEYPRYLSPKATQILKGLLTKDPRARLGSGPGDAGDIKNQAFFADLSWDGLMRGEVPPPWDPQINGSMDTSQFDHEFTNMPINSPGAGYHGHGFGSTPADNVFEGFTFTDRSFYGPNGPAKVG